MPKNKLIVVTAIVVAWNSEEYIESCLKSLLNSSFKCSILVIDNDSSDNTRNLVTANFPNVEVVNTGDNLGYAGGNNFAFRRLMKGPTDYFFIINPDATVSKSCIGKLVDRMESEKALSAACPMVYKNKTGLIWDAGGTINWDNGQTPHVGDNEIDTGQYATKAYTERLNGCAMLVRKSALQKVGLFDEDYFLYFEETDWSILCLKAGYKLGFVANATAFHEASAATGGTTSPTYEYYLTRNRLYFMHKNKESVARFYIIRIWYAQLYNLAQTMRKSGFKAFIRAAKYQIKGTSDYFRGKLGRQKLN